MLKNVCNRVIHPRKHEISRTKSRQVKWHFSATRLGLNAGWDESFHLFPWNDGAVDLLVLSDFGASPVEIKLAVDI
jgi:hypothetical protein